MTKFNDLLAKEKELVALFYSLESRALDVQRHYKDLTSESLTTQLARTSDEREFERLSAEGESVQKELQSVRRKIDDIFSLPSEKLLTLGTLHALLTRVLSRGVPKNTLVQLCIDNGEYNEGPGHYVRVGADYAQIDICSEGE